MEYNEVRQDMVKSERVRTEDESMSRGEDEAESGGPEGTRQSLGDEVGVDSEINQ
jgi:hypothetical protein